MRDSVADSHRGDTLRCEALGRWDMHHLEDHRLRALPLRLVFLLRFHRLVAAEHVGVRDKEPVKEWSAPGDAFCQIACVGRGYQ